jgi:gas vesicle protein GvpL/GvpF
MIHLYAFVDELDPAPALRGAATEPLDTHGFDGVIAVIGELAEPLPETTETAVAHGLVIESLRDHAAAVLPARLTRPFADRAALVAATQQSVPSLRRRLRCVRGCVELGLRVTARAADAAEPPTDGTAYMQRLAAAESVRRALADEAHALLRPHALDCRVQTPADPATVYRAAYLVRRDAAAGFARRAARLGERHPELALACTGPWAPYSFAEEAA